MKTVAGSAEILGAGYPFLLSFAVGQCLSASKLHLLLMVSSNPTGQIR